MDELINAMSSEDLAELKTKYSDNQSVATLIDGILETRKVEEIQEKAKAKFAKAIAKLFATLPHPDDIHNIYARWAEVDVPDGEPVDFAIFPDGSAKLASDLTPEEEALSLSIEPRTPTHKENQWVVEVNHATRVVSGGNGEPKTSKRAITVFKREGTTLIPKGNFASASKACEALGLTIGGDSAMRVLARDGFITEAYTGTEYTS